MTGAQLQLYRVNCKILRYSSFILTELKITFPEDATVHSITDVQNCYEIPFITSS